MGKINFSPLKLCFYNPMRPKFSFLLADLFVFSNIFESRAVKRLLVAASFALNISRLLAAQLLCDVQNKRRCLGVGVLIQSSPAGVSAESIKWPGRSELVSESHTFVGVPTFQQ